MGVNFALVLPFLDYRHAISLTRSFFEPNKDFHIFSPAICCYRLLTSKGEVGILLGYRNHAGLAFSTRTAKGEAFESIYRSG